MGIGRAVARRHRALRGTAERRAITALKAAAARHPRAHGRRYPRRERARTWQAARAAGLSAAMLDRLLLDAARIEAMAAGVEASPRCPTRSAACSPSGRGRTGS